MIHDGLFLIALGVILVGAEFFLTSFGILIVGGLISSLLGVAFIFDEQEKIFNSPFVLGGAVMLFVLVLARAIYCFSRKSSLKPSQQKETSL